MGNVLPQEVGVQVDQVFYRYTTVKNPQDDMTVTVQNEDAIRGGTIFKETDDWSQLPGNTITKIVPTPSVPIEYWGDGSIKTTGTGTVEDTKVLYSYKYDTCADPLSDPSCPGYDLAMNDYINSLGLDKSTDVKDPYQDFQQIQSNEVDVLEMKEDEEEENNKDEDKEEEPTLEEKLSVANTAIMNAEAVAQEAAFSAMIIPKFDTYYKSIPGGVYKEDIKYQSKQLPDSKSAKRVGLAQQILHTKMVDSQWKLGEKND